MKTLLRYAASAAVLACLPICALAATPFSKTPLSGIGQSNKPPASPDASAEVALKGKSIHIKYASPQMRGRVIMGELVPYGQVWRTGANSATSLTTDTELKIGDLTVPAGSYTLFTVPAAPGTPWQLIINKQTGQWGTEYDATQDLGRVELDAGKAEAPVETMTITLKAAGDAKGTLTIAWDKLSASAPFTAQ